MVTKKDAERDEAIEQLRKLVKPGDRIYTVLRKVSSSGMSRQIDVYVIKENRPWYLTGWVAKALGYSRVDEGTGPLRVGGTGMDMGFAVVYALSRTIFRDGWKCLGQKTRRCPSNDHNNDYNEFSRQYDEQHDPEGKLCYRGAELLLVERVAYTTAKSDAWEAGEAARWSRRRKHSDPGYALSQVWL